MTGHIGVHGVPCGLVRGRAEDGLSGITKGVAYTEAGVPCTESVFGIPVLTLMPSKPE